MEKSKLKWEDLEKNARYDPLEEELEETRKQKRSKIKMEKQENKNIEKIIVNHYPDSTKSRSSYLPLLELAIKENPENDRNMHYLGREYMYYGKYEEAITTLENKMNTVENL